jgi:Prolyl oligopeptidase family
MKRFRSALGAMAATILVAACGSDTQTSVMNDSTTHGTLVENPPLRIASLDAAAFQAELASTASGQQLLALTTDPVCGVDFYYLKFNTTGGAGEATVSSGAMMVPTGAAGTCSGPRPVVLYAHGTTTDKTYNIADITNTSNTEGDLIAAMFAAQGYIVVAPNYAGYDISTLGYHPYLDAAQQSGEMLDILQAARTALPKTLSSATSDSGKLFVTGYSQGGYVAAATQKVLQAANTPAHAVAGGSGPYALEAFGDAIFTGHVDLGSTVFAPLLTASYQHAYGNIYSAATDVFSSMYASSVATLLPSATPIATIFQNGQLPETALFDSTVPNATTYPTVPAGVLALLAAPTVNPAEPATEIWALGFGTPFLVTNDYRVSYVADFAGNPDGALLPTPTYGLAATVPTQTLRKALYTNDMRNGSWIPETPTLLCGGENDPTVFFTNTQIMEAFWTAVAPAPTGILNVLDVDPAGGPSGPFAAIQTAFQTESAATVQALVTSGLTLQQAEAEAIQNYHTGVAPFCMLAARTFFQTVP